jgi:hypothetical protein
VDKQRTGADRPCVKKKKEEEEEVGDGNIRRVERRSDDQAGGWRSI